MNNTDYTATEKKIRDLVPRLKELSFGCEYIGKQMKSPSKIHCIFRGYVQLVGKIDIKVEEFHDKLNRGVYKIIGHPIRLEDVLEAYREHKKDSLEEFELIVDACGTFGFVYADGTHEWAKTDTAQLVWATGKDFSQQRDETKMFIRDLLK